MKRPFLWVLFALASLAAVALVRQYFASAFPLVSLDMRMDREAALRSAAALAAAHRLGPPGFRQAATFGLDAEAQTFVELEGGGKEAFNRMLTTGLYAAYTWRVRHFKEGETNETGFRFTPGGASYGFMEKIREDAPGASLPASVAREIAEKEATAAWRVNLGAYQLAEQSQERRLGGRVDHRFVYERPERAGEGRYRVRLVVSGDKLTEVTHFLRIPEAFERRYEEMRSANTAIGVGSSVATVLLYGIGGIAVGLFVLLRRRWVIWRQAVLWGVFVALLQTLAQLNAWPLAWMTYDTALSTGSFVAQQIVFMLAGFFALAAVFSLSFMAAESLTRRAFPRHPQLWRIWSRGAAGSRAVLARTVAGYLWGGLFFAYEVALYFAATRAFGWWTPSEALLHPDVLATYLPWFSAIAQSFQAGFWEESLFRAVPLAGAALIGDRLGYRRSLIAGAMVVQAVVFGAGHAPYPTQPAYARVVELIVPSLAFGALYLRFGLLPAIILHFTFDVVWFALPLFVSSAPGIGIDRTLVVSFTLLPLWVVLWQRWRAGRWYELPDELLNGSWRPPEAPSRPRAAARSATRAAMHPAVARLLTIGGGVGLLVWAFSSSFRSEVPPLTLSRHEARRLAEKALADRHVTIGDRWRVLPAIEASPEPAHEFVRQTAGAGTYRALVGRYLNLPEWRVRVATFEGNVADRAEEWTVFARTHDTLRVAHELPEGRPGASLPEEQARSLAHATIRGRFGLESSQLREVSAAPSKLAARTDWVVTFRDETVLDLPQGEARIAVEIAGDEVTDAYRFVHVPEQWQRDRRNRETIALIARVVRTLVIAALLIAGGIAAVVSWSRRDFVARIFFSLLSALVLLRGIAFFNDWPSRIASFSTAQPWNLQILILLVGGLLAALVPSSLFGLVAGAVPRWTGIGHLDRHVAIRLGLGLGLLAAGVSSAMLRLRATATPDWPWFDGAGSYVPVAGAAVAALSGYVTTTTVVLLLVVLVERMTKAWTRRRGQAIALMLTAGVLLAEGSAENLPSWLATGVLAGIILTVAYATLFRFDVSSVPVATAVVQGLAAFRSGLQRAFPGSLTGALIGIALLAILSWWWFGVLRSTRKIPSGSADELARS